ncbi:hypothetical protein TcasGA2_TC000455 [Tribolium castaneum]|uniref:Uncharacterized protein n=1 Tax=Tribolium castaneum TaxID=7070 RepID=D6WA68_TRICA|nr:hypothetical protein TcasGA2_TC000455 [Tribolium castaneum]
MPCLNVRLHTDFLIVLTYKKQEFAAPILLFLSALDNNNPGIGFNYANYSPFIRFFSGFSNGHSLQLAAIEASQDQPTRKCFTKTVNQTLVTGGWFITENTVSKTVLSITLTTWYKLCCRL